MPFERLNDMTTFEPKNELEVGLVEAQSGRLSVPDLMRLLVKSELAVPSAGEVLEDGSGFQPLLFPKDQIQMLASFSDKERIGEFASMAPYCLVLKGRDLLHRMPPGYGLVVNPGSPIGFDISPEGIANVLRDFT
jgi:hypothetical protein